MLILRGFTELASLADSCTSLSCFIKPHLHYIVKISNILPRKYVALTSCPYQSLDTQIVKSNSSLTVLIIINNTMP